MTVMFTRCEDEMTWGSRDEVDDRQQRADAEMGTGDNPERWEETRGNLERKDDCSFCYAEDVIGSEKLV